MLRGKIIKDDSCLGLKQLRESWCQLLKIGKLEVKCLKPKSRVPFFREFATLRLVSKLIVNGSSEIKMR